jgi:hypothetical protein
VPCARTMPGEKIEAPMLPKACRLEMLIKRGPEG